MTIDQKTMLLLSLKQMLPVELTLKIQIITLKGKHYLAILYPLE